MHSQKAARPGPLVAPVAGPQPYDWGRVSRQLVLPEFGDEAQRPPQVLLDQPLALPQGLSVAPVDGPGVRGQLAVDVLGDRRGQQEAADLRRAGQPFGQQPHDQRDTPGSDGRQGRGHTHLAPRQTEIEQQQPYPTEQTGRHTPE